MAKIMERWKALKRLVGEDSTSLEYYLGKIEKGEDREAQRASGKILRMAQKNPESEKLLEAIPTLANGLGHQHWEVRSNCAGALAAMGERAISALSEAAESEGDGKGQTAILALGQIGGKSALEILLRELGKASPRGIYAVEGIGRIANKNPGAPELESAIGKCIELIRNESLTVRKNAANALGKIGGPSEIRCLLALMEDREHLVQMDAANAIGEIAERTDALEGVPELVSVLAKGIGSANSGVSINSATALSKIGGEGIWMLKALEESARKLKKNYAIDRAVRAKAISRIAVAYGKCLKKTSERAKAIIKDKSFHVPKVGKPDKTERILRVRRVNA